MATTVDLAGRHALVLGASSGIGRAAAMALAGAGARVTVASRSEDKLAALVPRLMEAGASDAGFVTVDMDDLDAFGGALADAKAQGGPLHIAVHNTGGPKSGPILEKTPQDLLDTFRRHQLTAHLLVTSLLPDMRAEGYGRFVHVLSTSAREPIENLGLSNAIRAGMVGWAKTVANELPSGVTINNVLPGYTATERLEDLKRAVAERTGSTPEAVEASWVAGIPEGRLGRPEEIGDAILFLASPLASYIRGASLAVEGGRLKGI